MPWAKKWPLPMNLPFFRCSSIGTGGGPESGQKNSKNAFRPAPVPKSTFPGFCTVRSVHHIAATQIAAMHIEDVVNCSCQKLLCSVIAVIVSRQFKVLTSPAWPSCFCSRFVQGVHPDNPYPLN